MAYLRYIDDPAIICDSTCFTVSSFDESIVYGPNSSMTGTQNVTFLAPAASASTPPAHIFPTLPEAHNFSVLGNPSKFRKYIDTELPLALADEAPMSPLAPSSPSSPPPPQPLPPISEKLRRSVNSAYINSFLKRPEKVITGPLEWVSRHVFPDTKLPVPFSQDNVSSCEKLWDSKSRTLSRNPTATTEAAVRIWLNHISSNLAATLNLNTGVSGTASADRGFDSRTATKGPAGGYMLRKPDISVINRTILHDSSHQDQCLRWHNIEAIIEVTASAPVKDVVRQISQKAACMFDVQPQRQFACALGIFGECNNLKYIFAVVDRAGITHSDLVSIEGYAALDFLRIVFAFCFASPETLGCDPSMEVNPETGDITHIAVNRVERGSTSSTKHRFAVVKPLHSSPILYGRGTRVWIVRDRHGSFYVLKDSWIQRSNTASEIEFIKHIKKVVDEDPDGRFFKHAYPKYYVGQDCVCSTDAIRGLLRKPPNRIQRRIVTGPIGDPLTSFRSKHEFVGIMLDIVNCMSYVHKLGKSNNVLDSLGVPLRKRKCYSWRYFYQQYPDQPCLGLLT